MLRLFQGAVLHGGPCRVRQAQGDASPAVAAPLEAFEHCPDAIISPFLAVHVTVAASLRRKFQRQAVRRLAEVQVALLRDKPEVVCRVTHHNPALLLAVVGGAQRQALRRERHGGGRCQRAPYIYVRPCRGFLGVVCSILQRVAVVLLRRDVRRLAIFDDRPVRIVEPCGHQRGVVPGFPDAHGEEDAVRLDGVAVRQFQLHHELHRVGAMRQVGRRYAEAAVGRRAGNAPVLHVCTVHVAAQGLRARAAQGVGHAESLSSRYGSGYVERTAQRELHHVYAPSDLRHLRLGSFADLNTHPHGIGAHAHILAYVYGVRASSRNSLRKRVAVCTLRDGYCHAPRVARALARCRVRLVVFVCQLHLVSQLHRLVRGDARQAHPRCGNGAATAASSEHVCRADHLARLVQQAHGVGLVVSLAYFVQLQGRAVGRRLLVYLRRHALAAHRVRRVLVHGLVHLHHRDVQAGHSLAVRGQLLGGRAFRHPDSLYRVTAAVAVPRRGCQEGRGVSPLKAVVLPFACAGLECYHHARLRLVSYVGACQSRHGRLLRVVAGWERVQLRHVVETAAASAAARLHKVILLVAPHIERVAADVRLVLQGLVVRPVVQAALRPFRIPALVVYEELPTACAVDHILRRVALVCAAVQRRVFTQVVHDTPEPRRRTFQGGLGRAFV